MFGIRKVSLRKYTGVLDDLRVEGKTAIIATHDIGRLESDFDDVLFLADGHQVTAAAAFATEHGHPAPGVGEPALDSLDALEPPGVARG